MRVLSDAHSTKDGAIVRTQLRLATPQLKSTPQHVNAFGHRAVSRPKTDGRVESATSYTIKALVSTHVAGRTIMPSQGVLYGTCTLD
eukprot:SAG11_NODE_22138_length_411_cov_1.057692_1_plen_86_part_10